MQLPNLDLMEWPGLVLDDRDDVSDFEFVEEGEITCVFVVSEIEAGEDEGGCRGASEL